MKITFVQGDITEQDVDAIVNAANHSLLGAAGSMEQFIVAEGRRFWLNVASSDRKSMPTACRPARPSPPRLADSRRAG